MYERKENCVMKTTTQQPTRRRRFCSVVPPKLMTDGTKTIVVNEITEMSHDSQTNVPVAPVQKQNTNKNFSSNYCTQTLNNSQTMSPSGQVQFGSGLKRHNSLPRRTELIQANGEERIRIQTLRNSFRKQIDSRLEHLHNHVESQKLDTARKTENSVRGFCNAPELAINLSPSPELQIRGTDLQAQQQRKTQRSMSAHSVALPGPDSSVLRDPISGKMYKRGKLLGKGGFARVYDGMELGTSKKYALKIIDKSRLSRPPQRGKVDAEIELHSAASRVGHPNVAGFECAFENARIICLVLELCEKKSLAQYLRRKEFLSEREVSDITWQIISGLAHLHGCGLLHRDLKLGNIFLADDMTAKIGDFGLASRIAWGKRRTICGTPNFIAPEVLQRQGHGPEADIWAAGCIVYTLLVGKPPFETTSLKDTYKCILKNSYRIPSTVSQEAADLVRKMLRSKPHARPSVHDVMKHAFFVKHQTHMRYPSLETLNRKYPSVEMATEKILPLRRKSVLPHLTIRQGDTCETMGTLSSNEARHNSCPSDPCSAYITPTTTTFKISPSYSVGPKRSVRQLPTPLTEKETKDKSISKILNKTFIENINSFEEEAKSVEHENAQNNNKSETKVNDACNQNFTMTKLDDVTCKEKDDSPTNLSVPNVINNTNTVTGKPVDHTTHPLKTTTKIKSSPVKLLASKLQKFKIPSPKSCMKAATNTMKSKSNGFKTTTTDRPVITTRPWAEVPEATWITKWVDYSNRYGFGYQLADRSICVLFNDGAHIALLPDQKTVEYREPEWESNGCNCTFQIHSPPPSLVRTVKVLHHFIAYMDKNLKLGNDDTSRHDVDDEVVSKRAATRMLTWNRTGNHVAMYLSDGTLQVNFWDHSKINVSNIHRKSSMKITCKSPNKEIATYSSSDLAAIRGSEFAELLKEVHREFHLLLGNDQCCSHPFCSALQDNASENQATFTYKDTHLVAAM